MDIRFVIAGGRHCGTTWLHTLLEQNPHVALATAVKETRFFTTKHGNGIDWYRSLFPADITGRVVGEVDPSCFMHHYSAENINETASGAKVIFILRRPPELSHSGFLFSRREGTFRGTEEKRWATSYFARRDVAFGSILKEFYDRFPWDQIYVTLFDDLRADPVQFYTKICDFIGVPAVTDPALFTRKANFAASSRVPWLTNAIYHVKHRARQGDLHWLVNGIKRAGGKRLFDRLFKPDSSKISPELEHIIMRDTRDEVSLASDLTGIDLLKRWGYGQVSSENDRML